VQHVVDEAQEAVVEVSSIGSHDEDAEVIEQYDRHEHGDSQRALVAVGGGNHEKQGQIGPATQDGMHLVAEDTAFPL
jgi:hypothetical protein